MLLICQKHVKCKHVIAKDMDDNLSIRDTKIGANGALVQCQDMLYFGNGLFCLPQFQIMIIQHQNSYQKPSTSSVDNGRTTGTMHLRKSRKCLSNYKFQPKDSK